MVEIEIGVTVAQCLARRIPDKATLVSEVISWEKRRNTERARINWMFTVERARVKLGEPTHSPQISHDPGRCLNGGHLHCILGY